MKLGYPADNAVIIEQLDEARKVVQGTMQVAAATGRLRVGSGSATDPFVVDALPFTDLRSLAQTPASPITDWSSCMGGKTGPTLFYRLDVTAATPVRVRLTSRLHSPAHAFLRHLTGTVDTKNCTASVDRGALIDDMYRLTLQAGAHYFAVAAPAFTAGATAPEFIFVVQPCSSDALCQ
jgi:hypothetical protein